jgi:hypothetical protein
VKKKIKSGKSALPSCLLCLFVAILFSGCSKTVEKKSASEPILSQQFRRQSVTVIVSVSETNISTAGNLQLMLDVQAPPGSDVGFPEIKNFVEPFFLSGSYSEPKQTLPNRKILHRRVWILVPSLPGEVIFKPLEITAGTTFLKTAPITISVNSILPEELDAFEIKDIAAAATLLPEQQKKREWALKIFAGAIGFTLVVLACKIRKRPMKIIVLPPHETAFQALENLPEDPVARIHKLNRILREYIETRFNFPMIGKTTSEILPNIGNSEMMGSTPELVEFLERGEEIRFSNMIPNGFTEEAEQFVREFVETTKKEDPCD